MMKKETRLNLYPLKFKPLFREKPWGGSRIRDDFGYTGVPEGLCGEAWLLSAVPGSESVVDNGPLKGNSLAEVYEIFMEELVGEKVYKKSPDQFPLLIKILDANEWLSVQVHPDDDLAMERYGTTGKSEMWYILDAAPDAQLISGFEKEAERNTLVFLTENGLLPDILHYEKVSKGDLFYTPAGRIHAIGPGTLLAEIQQTSDTTYRLYDWNRTDESGKLRETHLSQAIEALDFSIIENAKTEYTANINTSNPLLSEEHFTANLIVCHEPMNNDYTMLDSFVILMFTEGEGTLLSENILVPYHKGEVILLPAYTEKIDIVPAAPTEIIEVFV